MNILITGKNGFIGHELSVYYSNTEHNIYTTCRKTLDVSDWEQVRAFFDSHEIDVVIHTAIKGGRRTDNDTFEDFVINLNMFNNLRRCLREEQLLISFGSGAEAKTDTYYGLAKNLINKEILKTDNCVNLRLYGCFGPSEAENRFIKNSFNRVLKKQPILIHQDKYMDYLYIEDLKKIIDHYIYNYRIEKLPSSLDLCYKEKVTLFQIAEQIKNLTNDEVAIIIDEKGYGAPYVGANVELSALNIKLHGLREGIKRTIKDLQANNG